MKRSPLKRGRPLQAKPKPCCGRSLCSCGEPPALKRSPIKPAPKAKREERFRANYHSSEFVKWVHGFPCALCDVTGWTEAAHVKRRSQGGKAEANIVPLCGNRTGVRGCHEAFDHYEREDHRMRLKAMAKALWKMWQVKTAVEE